jgi:hypothetical protein
MEFNMERIEIEPDHRRLSPFVDGSAGSLSGVLK